MRERKTPAHPRERAAGMTGKLVPMERQFATPATKVVYLVEAGDRYKIGFTTDLERRMRELAVGSPVPLSVIKVVKGSYALESALHEVLKPWRQHGEWFDLPTNLLDLVGRLLEAREINELLTELESMTIEQWALIGTEDLEAAVEVLEQAIAERRDTHETFWSGWESWLATTPRWGE